MFYRIAGNTEQITHLPFDMLEEYCSNIDQMIKNMNDFVGEAIKINSTEEVKKVRFDVAKSNILMQESPK